MTVEHVVVLMMENRSFDHMLGFLDHPSPEFPRLRAAEPYANPVNPLSPAADRVLVSADAEPLLAHDPPHGHASVLEQLGVPVLGPPRMDGFIAAYSRKLAGHEARPVIHWGRIAGAAAAVLLAGVGLCALRSFWGSLAVAVALEALALTLYRLRGVLPPFRHWGLGLAAPVVGAAAAYGIALLLPYGYWWRVLALALPLLVVGAIVAVPWRRQIDSPPDIDPGYAPHVMRCMDPGAQLPALATLATSFAVCTRWHAPVPGATWPNRTMVHAATADDTVDNEIRLYGNATIFERLTAAGRDWHIYRDPAGLAQVMAFDRLWSSDAALANWYLMDSFAEHVASGALPAYSFIEPCHDGPTSNSQHPGNNTEQHGTDFARGEQLIASVYETLRAAPEVFAKTVLVITYDEHGGFYDHVPPPRDFPAPEPFAAPLPRSLLRHVLGWFVEQPTSRFAFRLLGPRVPAVVVSPLVAAAVDDTLYDHTAITATLRALFAPGAEPLSRRDAESSTLSHLWGLAEPRTDLPDLSAHARTFALGDAAAAAGPPAERDDQFARQLRRLGELVRDELKPRTPGLLAVDDPAALFTAAADAARRRR